MSGLSTPILFIIFNRPVETARVFETIRIAKPERLFIAADGPRPSQPGEEVLCKELRQYVLAQINWPCEVKTLFREKNLGCKLAVSSAIDWFFENVEEGIILEDDCLPDSSFFPYCAELLQRYRTQENIFMISGDNFLPSHLRLTDSYYFSQIPHIWGWATWRRAWQEYDVTITDLPEFFKKRKIENIWGKKNVQKYWLNIFQEVYEGKIDTWDYQWAYAIWKNNGLSVAPGVNLVSNLGFGSGTHTLNKNDVLAELPVESLNFPLVNTDKNIFKLGDDYENKKFFLKNNYLKIFLKTLGLLKISRLVRGYLKN